MNATPWNSECKPKRDQLVQQQREASRTSPTHHLPCEPPTYTATNSPPSNIDIHSRVTCHQHVSCVAALVTAVVQHWRHACKQHCSTHACNSSLSSATSYYTFNGPAQQQPSSIQRNEQMLTATSSHKQCRNALNVAADCAAGFAAAAQLQAAAGLVQSHQSVQEL